jgi:CheY-like chemotaxis protein
MIPEPPVIPRILLVDDEAQLLELCAQVMKLRGFSVVTAEGPVQAISMMAEEMIEKIDVAILDYHMPVMNGCALADRLRSMHPKLKIILYSGAIDIPQSEMTSVDVFIPKDDGISRLVPQIVQFAQVGTGLPTTVAPGAELGFRTESGQF